MSFEPFSDRFQIILGSFSECCWIVSGSFPTFRILFYGFRGVSCFVFGVVVAVGFVIFWLVAVVVVLSPTNQPSIEKNIESVFFSTRNGVCYCFLSKVRISISQDWADAEWCRLESRMTVWAAAQAN